MEFRLDSKDYGDEELVSAVLKVYLKTKGRRRRRRIVLHVSENIEDGKLSEFATVKLRVKRKGWQKITLPIYLLKKLQREPIKLHVGCEKCNKKVRLVLPRSNRSNRSKKVRDLGVRNKRSPVIVLNTKRDLRLQRNRRDADQKKNLNRSETASGHHFLKLLGQIGGGGGRGGANRYDITTTTTTTDGLTDRDGLSTGINSDNNSRDSDDSEDDDVINDYDDNDDNDDDDDSDDDSDDDDDDDDYDDDVIVGDSDTDSTVDADDGEEDYGDGGDTDGRVVCCMTSRFVSFQSIRLQHLIVKPLYGFVSNQCGHVCPRRSRPTATTSGRGGVTETIKAAAIDGGSSKGIYIRRKPHVTNFIHHLLPYKKKNRHRDSQQTIHRYKNGGKRIYLKPFKTRSCTPIAYRHFTLSFITRYLKVQNMTIPDAIVTKCGYR